MRHYEPVNQRRAPATVEFESYSRLGILQRNDYTTATVYLMR